MSEPIVTQPPAPSPLGDLFAGTPYRLLDRIASGGMGEVYLVSHRKLGRRLAAKVMHATLAKDPKLVDRVRVEAQALSRLRHANIVAVMGFGTLADKRPFIVMEELHGHTLDEVLKNKGHLDTAESLDLTAQLLSALAAAHELGIVHRDIKPSNLFLCGPSEDGYRLKVLDFGIARVMPGISEAAPLPVAEPTASGVVMGTPRFVSPEGAKGQRVDPRADLYAAALVLYYLVSGRGPFDEIARDTALLAAHANQEPPPLSRLAPGRVPPELDRIVAKALRKDPLDRYQTAEEFLSDVERVLSMLLCPAALQPTSVVGAVASHSGPIRPHIEAPAGDISLDRCHHFPLGDVEGTSPMSIHPSVKEQREEELGPLKVGSRLRKYDILQQIGQGGYASVYRARDTVLQRDVAIKVVHRLGGVTEDMMRRGKAEAAFLTRVHHPNIVEVFDADISDNGLLYIVMEHLVGRSLYEVFREHGRLAIEEALSFTIQVADAVEAAHALGAIHRDLKPENIFVLADNRIKVLDFGIAKFMNEVGARTTAKDALQGSILYMSPEHVQAMRVGPATDIYALAVILYRALAGEHPVLLDLDHPTPWQIAHWHVHTMPRPLAEIAPWVPRHVSRFISSVCAKDPQDRPKTMAETAERARATLQRFLTETKGELKGKQRDLSRSMQDTDPRLSDFELKRLPARLSAAQPSEHVVLPEAEPRQPTFRRTWLLWGISALAGPLVFGGATKAYVSHRRSPVESAPSATETLTPALPPTRVATLASSQVRELPTSSSSAAAVPSAATAGVTRSAPPAVRKALVKPKPVETESERRLRAVEEDLRRLQRASSKGAK